MRRLGVTLVAMTGRLESTLARHADIVLPCAVDQEACPMNLSPTASTTAQMALGDALAVALLDARGFREDDFARSHPGGALGRRLLLKVSDVMRQGEAIPRVFAETAMTEGLLEMSRKGLGMTIVTDQEGHALGVYTDGDLRRTLQRHPPEAWASVEASAMATTDPISVTPDTLAAEALRVMERNPAQALSVLPVIDGGELVGLLRLHDLVQAGFTSNQAASAAAAPKP